MPLHCLPAGVKSLQEICNYPIADQRVYLVTLLEFLLRHLDGGSTDTRLRELITLHEDKFTCSQQAIHKARWVRNQLIHGTGKATPEDAILAAAELRQAIADVSHSFGDANGRAVA